MGRSVGGGDEGTQGAANQVQVVQIHSGNKLQEERHIGKGEPQNDIVVLKVEDEITIKASLNSS